MVFGWISGKMDKIIKNLGKLSRSFAVAKRPLAAAKDPHAAVRSRGKVGSASGLLRRSHCSQHGNVCVFVSFCFSVVPKICLLDY